jgi:RHS repeat-associated protein
VFDGFGNITSETHYNSSGSTVTSGQTGYIDEAFAYTGRLFDKTTGLQNNLNRWYSPSVGRWMSEDPVGFEAGDANLYRYVGNSPTNYNDPEGFYAWWPPSKWWPWGPKSEGGAGEWADDMKPHVGDGAMEAIKIPVPVGPACEALHAGEGLTADACVLLKKKRYEDMQKKPGPGKRT